MAIDADRATEAGKKGDNKTTMSVSMDPALKDEFIAHCKKNKLKFSPIVEDLVEQYMEAIRGKRKK